MTSGTTTVESSARASSRKQPASARRWAREHDLLFPSAVFALHWIYVTLFAALATRYANSLPVVKAVGYQLPQMDGWQRYLLQPMRNWDGFWYTLIAERGYESHTATTAFWPLFPWTMRITANLFSISPEIAGLLLANAAFLGALIVLQRLVKREWGDGAARRAVLLLAFFPTAFYFSAVYSESFFLLFSLLVFYWGRERHWWLAGGAALLAALTRNIGVLLAIPLGIMFLKAYGVDPRRWPREWLAVGIPALGPLIYMVVLWRIYDDPLLTLEAQKGWARTQAMPWTTFQMAFEQVNFSWLRMLAESPTWATLTSKEVRFTFSEYESLDIIMTVLILPVLLYTLTRLPLEYGLYTLIVFALPLFSPSTVHPLMSFPRFFLVLFPIFVALALLTRRRSAFIVVAVASATLLAILTIQFSTWFWVA